MLGLPVFYNQSIRKYVGIFGTLFNELKINRVTETGAFHSVIDVPISYGPKQKYIARINSNSDLDKDRHQIVIPRMSFEITSMDYDSERAGNKLNRVVWDEIGNNTVKNFKLMPVPYNFSFQLSIMVLNAEDGTRIIEQILPFFTPNFTVAAKLVEGTSNNFDIPIVMESVSIEDIYDGEFDTRRTLVWTLEFTMKAWLFGPDKQKGIIREINTNLFDEVRSTDAAENIKIVPSIVGQKNVDPDTVDPTDDWEGVTTITRDDTN